VVDITSQTAQFGMKRSNVPGEKVMAFCGSEKAEEVLRFSTCFQKSYTF